MYTMYICIHPYNYIYIYVYIYINIYYIYISIYIYIYIYISQRERSNSESMLHSLQLHMCVYIYIFTCKHIYIYIHTYIHLYTCICICFRTLTPAYVIWRIASRMGRASQQVLPHALLANPLVRSSAGLRPECYDFVDSCCTLFNTTPAVSSMLHIKIKRGQQHTCSYACRRTVRVFVQLGIPGLPQLFGAALGLIEAMSVRRSQPILRLLCLAASLSASWGVRGGCV